MKNLVINLMLIAVTSVALMTPANAEVQVVKVSESMRVRAAPDTNARTLGSAKPGMDFRALSVRDGWTEVRFNGQRGWIRQLPVSAAAEPVAASVAAIQPIQAAVLTPVAAVATPEPAMTVFSAQWNRLGESAMNAVRAYANYVWVFFALVGCALLMGFAVTKVRQIRVESLYIDPVKEAYRFTT